MRELIMLIVSVSIPIILGTAGIFIDSWRWWAIIILMSIIRILDITDNDIHN